MARSVDDSVYDRAMPIPTKEDPMQQTATKYAIRLMLDGEVRDEVPVDTGNAEHARGLGFKLIEERWPERSRTEDEVRVVFLMEGQPYSNIFGGYFDAQAERTITKVRDVLTDEPTPTFDIAYRVGGGLSRERALSALSVLLVRGQVIRSQPVRHGNYSWRRAPRDTSLRALVLQAVRTCVREHARKDPLTLMDPDPRWRMIEMRERREMNAEGRWAPECRTVAEIMRDFDAYEANGYADPGTYETQMLGFASNMDPKYHRSADEIVVRIRYGSQAVADYAVGAYLRASCWQD